MKRLKSLLNRFKNPLILLLSYSPLLYMGIRILIDPHVWSKFDFFGFPVQAEAYLCGATGIAFLASAAIAGIASGKKKASPKFTAEQMDLLVMHSVWNKKHIPAGRDRNMYGTCDNSNYEITTTEWKKQPEKIAAQINVRLNPEFVRAVKEFSQ